MGIMTIDGQAIEFTDEPNVLSVIRKAGIDIPTLCYWNYFWLLTAEIVRRVSRVASVICRNWLTVWEFMRSALKM